MIAATAPKPYTHLTIIPDRYTGTQKAHTAFHHAKAAVRGSVAHNGTTCDIQVYELVDGEWSLLWEIPKGTKKPDLPWQAK